MLDLTALIACKNRNANLAFCLRSIACCTPRPKVVVVDFGSKHPLLPINFPQSLDLSIVRVTRHTEMFHKARALNVGIKKIGTTYSCITDSDQIFEPTFFGCVYNQLQTPDTFVMCSTYFLAHLPGGFKVQDLTKKTYYTLLNKAKREQFKKPHGEGCCHGVETQWLQKVRGYDEQYIGWGFEDKDLTLRASIAGKKVQWVHSATSMVHLPHPRDRTYFNFERRTRNAHLFEKKRKTKEVVANLASTWGAL